MPRYRVTAQATQIHEVIWEGDADSRQMAEQELMHLHAHAMRGEDMRGSGLHIAEISADVQHVTSHEVAPGPHPEHAAARHTPPRELQGDRHPPSLLSTTWHSRTPPHPAPVPCYEEPMSQPVDSTPVPLPGGGERSRTLGHLMLALARAQHGMRQPHIGTSDVTMAPVRDALLPQLTAHAVALTQWVQSTEREVICWTLLGHASGEYIVTPMHVPGHAISDATGSALQAVAMVVGDTDDAGARTRPEQPHASTAQPSEAAVADLAPTADPRTSCAQLEDLVAQVGGNLEQWLTWGEEQFHTPRASWGEPHYLYLLRTARMRRQGTPPAHPEG